MIFGIYTPTFVTAKNTFKDNIPYNSYYTLIQKMKRMRKIKRPIQEQKSTQLKFAFVQFGIFGKLSFFSHSLEYFTFAFFHVYSCFVFNSVCFVFFFALTVLFFLFYCLPLRLLQLSIQHTKKKTFHVFTNFDLTVSYEKKEFTHLVASHNYSAWVSNVNWILNTVFNYGIRRRITSTCFALRAQRETLSIDVFIWIILCAITGFV